MQKWYAPLRQIPPPSRAAVKAWNLLDDGVWNAIDRGSRLATRPLHNVYCKHVTGVTHDIPRPIPESIHQAHKLVLAHVLTTVAAIVTPVAVAIYDAVDLLIRHPSLPIASLCLLLIAAKYYVGQLVLRLVSGLAFKIELEKALANAQGNLMSGTDYLVQKARPFVLAAASLDLFFGHPVLRSLELDVRVLGVALSLYLISGSNDMFKKSKDFVKAKLQSAKAKVVELFAPLPQPVTVSICNVSALESS